MLLLEFQSSMATSQQAAHSHGTTPLWSSDQMANGHTAKQSFTLAVSRMVVLESGSTPSTSPTLMAVYCLWQLRSALTTFTQRLQGCKPWPAPRSFSISPGRVMSQQSG